MLLNRSGTFSFSIWSDTIIKIVITSRINFPMKSIDSWLMLRRNQHKIFRKMYEITKHSKKMKLEKKV